MKPEGKLTMAGALVGAVVVLVGLLVFGPPAKADGGVIGYVGCSNTRMSVQVDHDLARRGPQMSNLPISDTRGDGCHPNQVGAEQLGQDLLAFFG